MLRLYIDLSPKPYKANTVQTFNTVDNNTVLSRPTYKLIPLENKVVDIGNFKIDGIPYTNSIHQEVISDLVLGLSASDRIDYLLELLDSKEYIHLKQDNCVFVKL